MSNLVTIYNSSNVKSWICGGLLFVLSYPKWFWNKSEYILIIASYLLLFFSYKDIVNKSRWVFWGIIGLLLQTVVLWDTYVLSNTNMFGVLMVFIRAIGFIPLFFCSANFWKQCVDCFIKILAVLLIFALAEHILISFLNVSVPVRGRFECPLNPGRPYYGFFFNVYLETHFDFFARFHAFYDEPGVLGNIAMVLLYIQKFDLKKWYNVVILISGVLSFSLAFIIAIAAYYILFGGVKQKIFFAALAIAGFYYFYNNEYIYKYVFGRLEFENGSLSGYNREGHTDINYWLNGIPVVKYLFWGYQPRDSVPYAASWKWAFALYGIIPSIVYLVSVIVPRAIQTAKKHDILKGIVLVVIIWIQRPFIYMFLYAFLIVIPFIYYFEPKNHNMGNESSKKQIQEDGN